MPRVGGVYQPPAGNPVVTGTTIDASWANDTVDDLGNEITNSLEKNNPVFTAPILAASGTKSAPGIAWSTEAGMGFYRAGAAETRFAISNVDRLKLLAGANPLLIFESVTGFFFPVVDQHELKAINNGFDTTFLHTPGNPVDLSLTTIQGGIKLIDTGPFYNAQDSDDTGEAGFLVSNMGDFTEFSLRYSFGTDQIRLQMETGDGGGVSFVGLLMDRVTGTQLRHIDDLQKLITLVNGIAVTGKITATTSIIGATMDTLAANSWTKQQYINEVVPADLSASWNFNNDQAAAVTLATGTLVIATPTNLKEGAVYTLRVVQPAGGDGLITWPSLIKWIAGAVPTLSTAANGTDLMSFYSDGTTLYGTYALDFS